MSSIEESKRQVRAGLEQQREEVDHDAILASLQDEIDKHNMGHKGTKNAMHKSEEHGSEASRSRSMKFRFKDSTGNSRKRKHRSHHEHKRKHRSRKASPGAHDDESAHPFPREPADPVDKRDQDPNAAFRESLFDALADDEGAAYWESVYSQPIHIYGRPSMENARGELEEMDDEKYAAYVQTKMWERKHPEIVRERQKKERQRKEEGEDRSRRRAEFVRKKERAAWENAQRWTAYDSDEEDSRRSKRHAYEFTGDANMASERQEEEAEYAAAWARYLAAWDKLKQDLLAIYKDPEGSSKASNVKPSTRLPWPVLSHKTVTKPNIEAFIRNAPSDSDHPRLRILKAERVRWHPDKIQQRFGGNVDEGTMKVVTGIFQVIDGLVEEERKSTG